jgi:hypothetical protein
MGQCMHVVVVRLMRGCRKECMHAVAACDEIVVVL